MSIIVNPELINTKSKLLQIGFNRKIEIESSNNKKNVKQIDEDDIKSNKNKAFMKNFLWNNIENPYSLNKRNVINYNHDRFSYSTLYKSKFSPGPGEYFIENKKETKQNHNENRKIIEIESMTKKKDDCLYNIYNRKVIGRSNDKPVRKYKKIDISNKYKFSVQVPRDLSLYLLNKSTINNPGIYSYSNESHFQSSSNFSFCILNKSNTGSLYNKNENISKLNIDNHKDKDKYNILINEVINSRKALSKTIKPIKSLSFSSCRVYKTYKRLNDSKNIQVNNSLNNSNLNIKYIKNMKKMILEEEDLLRKMV